MTICIQNANMEQNRCFSNLFHLLLLQIKKTEWHRKWMGRKNEQAMKQKIKKSERNNWRKDKKWKNKEQKQIHGTFSKTKARKEKRKKNHKMTRISAKKEIPKTTEFKLNILNESLKDIWLSSDSHQIQFYGN